MEDSTFYYGVESRTAQANTFARNSFTVETIMAKHKRRNQSQKNNVIGKATPKQILHRKRYQIKGTISQNINLLEWMLGPHCAPYLTGAEKTVVKEIQNQFVDWFSLVDSQTAEMKEALDASGNMD